MNQLQALQPERLTDTVYTLLRERILGGDFRPGEKLNVDLLAQQLGISQTPIKGALTRLVAEGLVQIQPRRGTFVADVSEREFDEALAIRRALELLAAETIIDHATPADVMELTEMARQIEEASDVNQHFRNNVAFHQRLVQLSGNQKLAELYRQLNGHIHIILIHARSINWRSRVTHETIEHRAIIEAIASQDRERLKAALAQHLQRSRESLLDQLASAHRGERAEETP